MSSNEHNFVHEFMEVLDKLARVYTDTQRARETSSTLDGALDVSVDVAVDTSIVDTLTPLVEMLAKVPVWDTLKVMVQDVVTQKLEADSYNPVNAVTPARHLLQALDTIHAGGVELQRWLTDGRFNPPKPTPSPAPRHCKLFDRKPQPQRVSVPVAEIIEQLQYLMGLLTIAEQEAQLALKTLAHMRDPRLHVTSEHMRPELEQVESFEHTLPLPTSWRQSKGENGRDLLDSLEQFGKYLALVAKRGQERVRNASVDDKAYSPAVVAAQAATIHNIVKNALATCSALVFVSMQYLGDKVIIE